MFRLLRFYSPIALLHLYVAARLIPDLLSAGALAVAALSVWLARLGDPDSVCVQRPAQHRALGCARARVDRA